MTETSRRAVRDEIEHALQQWAQENRYYASHGLHLDDAFGRRVAAGILRKIRDNEMAKLETELREAQDAIGRVRDVLRRYDSPVSSRLIEMALYGEEMP